MRDGAHPARRLPLAVALAALAAGGGCISVRAGTEDSSFFKIRGLAHAYGSFQGIHPYDGTFFRLGFLKDTRKGELLSVEIWPLVGAGIGVVGARIQLLPLEVGAGVLFYDPAPLPRPEKADEEPGTPDDPARDTPGSKPKEPSRKAAPIGPIAHVAAPEPSATPR
jgi:hypothetical protein